MSVDLFEELSVCTKKVNEFLTQPRFKEQFRPKDIQEAVFAYLERSGKRLRPAVMLWSCGAVGGDENMALPAAAGIEMFHTWTLVHDDLIDNDDLRRGGPTVHNLGKKIASESMGYNEKAASDYGRDLAILSGDCQHGWTVSMFCECAKSGVDPAVVIEIIHLLESYVVNTLIEGEMLDVQYSKVPIEKLSENEIIKMLWMKTGALYEFAARAGAMIGLKTTLKDQPQVAAIAGFASDCGIAFQLQDDVLGLLGKEEKLGKPIGSDIREGKKTLIVYHALNSCNPEQKEFLLSTLGNRNASEEDVEKATQLMVSLKAVDKVSELAVRYITSAMSKLQTLPASKYKDLLKAWADFMVSRAH